MGLLILPKQFHPDFAIKNRKPVGEIEVDWANQITRGLEAAYIFDNELSVRDYAKSIHNGTATGTPNFIGTIRGRSLNFSGSSEFMSIPDHQGLNFLTGEDFTFVNGIIANDTGAAEVFEKQLGQPFYQLASQTTWNFFVRNTAGGAAFITSSRNVVANEYVNVACVRRTGGTNTISVNGLLVGSLVDPGGDVNPATPLKICQGNLGTFNGKLFYMWVFRRALSTAEIKSLNIDPYQILKPATPITYFTPSGAVAESITADSGSYIYTGTDTPLVTAFNATALSGSYSISGTTTPIIADVNVVANAGSYALTGTNIDLRFGSTITVDAGSYAQTGTLVNLNFIGNMTVDAGSYIITGTDIPLLDAANIWTDQAIIPAVWVDGIEQVTTWTDESLTTTIWTDI